MKVNYLPKNRLRHPYFRRILALVAIFVFGAVVFSFFEATIISIVSPVWQAENVIIRNLRNGMAFFGSQQALVEENAVLKEKLSSLEIKILSLSREQVQESALLELVGRRSEPNMIAAAVLTHSPQTPYDTIIIDAGSNQSITLGSAVSLPEGSILGVVSEVFSKRARVKLLSTSGQETNAVLERDNVPVILVGTGGGNFKLVLPRDLAVERGDMILSAGITSRLLAIVEEISLRPTEPFKEVLARSPTNIFALRFVFVTP